MSFAERPQLFQQDVWRDVATVAKTVGGSTVNAHVPGERGYRCGVLIRRGLTRTDLPYADGMGDDDHIAISSITFTSSAVN